MAGFTHNYSDSRCTIAQIKLHENIVWPGWSEKILSGLYTALTLTLLKTLGLGKTLTAPQTSNQCLTSLMFLWLNGHTLPQLCSKTSGNPYKGCYSHKRCIKSGIECSTSTYWYNGQLSTIFYPYSVLLFYVHGTIIQQAFSKILYLIM